MNKVIEASKLRPWCAAHNVYLLTFIVEQNSVGIDVVVFAVRLSPFRKDVKT